MASFERQQTHFFEYKLVEAPEEATSEYEAAEQEMLNRLGRDGWELTGNRGNLLYFKRRVLIMIATPRANV
jgi:hypothetical protein